ncbi:hypothetical protein J1614_004568 [Plenodomus biglobosus]|nr:hypothetical protein J1614_004568 [Plenodomus biglobosus]
MHWRSLRWAYSNSSAIEHSPVNYNHNHSQAWVTATETDSIQGQYFLGSSQDLIFAFVHIRCEDANFHKTTAKTSKSTSKPTTTRSEEVGPSSTACPVPRHYQCGGYYDGVPWTGCTQCIKGTKCVEQNGELKAEICIKNINTNVL